MDDFNAIDITILDPDHTTTTNVTDHSNSNDWFEISPIPLEYEHIANNSAYSYCVIV
ncbi:hypothetical protein QCA50_016182 [Cerrena zonata]|uniref:Pheromone n=1 Tax=Cerrena zonata TaxID=2478898 RepID=A0AAW0FL38_9APHY